MSLEYINYHLKVVFIFVQHYQFMIFLAKIESFEDLPSY